TILYLGAYTPLKRVSWICNIVCSIPGALPPVVGWLAARPNMSVEPALLFAIMYLWQLPHSLSIARLYRADYEKAGIHLYPPDGRRGNIANSVIVGDSLVLIAVSILPTLLGFAGIIYMTVALVLGAAMLLCGVNLFRAPERSLSARRVLMASLVYLPLVLLVLVLDKV
ncbi:MAG: UbiA family prenyltransferase, partial [Candidatus Binataceae bacterium]